MKKMRKVGMWFFGILFWIFLALALFDDLRDLNALAGVVGVLVGLSFLPLTFFALPAYLIVTQADWWLALETYIVLPILVIPYLLLLGDE